MKTVKSILLFVISLCIISSMAGCGAEKYATQRRNLMLVSKSDMPNNQKYKEVTKRKTNKVKVKKTKRKSLY